jgi:nucleoside-diphosphate kinase
MAKQLAWQSILCLLLRPKIHLIMSGNRTLTIIKPDAVAKNFTGNIIQKITDAGFRIVAMKYTWLTAEQASQFYLVHRERPFYNGLVSFMSSGAIVPAILEKEDAVEDFRKLIGATDPDDGRKFLFLGAGVVLTIERILKGNLLLTASA